MFLLVKFQFVFTPLNIYTIIFSDNELHSTYDTKFDLSGKPIIKDDNNHFNDLELTPKQVSEDILP